MSGFRLPAAIRPRSSLVLPLILAAATAVAGAPAAADLASLPPSPAAAAAPDRPIRLPAATLGYVVYRDGVGFSIGRSEHRIERSGAAGYRIGTSWETAGLAAVLKRVRVDHVSEGELVDGRLRPLRYRSWRSDKKKEAQADFDWRTMQVAQAAGAEPLPAGTLDPVALFYQLSIVETLPSELRVAPLDAATELRVANGRRIKTLKVERLGEAMLTLPDGQSLSTRHLRLVEDDGETTELWLSAQHAGYPLQIAHTDRDGTRYRQLADLIRIDADALVQGTR